MGQRTLTALEAVEDERKQMRSRWRGWIPLRPDSPLVFIRRERVKRWGRVSCLERDLGSDEVGMLWRGRVLVCPLLDANGGEAEEEEVIVTFSFAIGLVMVSCC